MHHALHLAELTHRGEEIGERLRKRAVYRRRRRATNLRYRAPRFLNRRRPPGWLPPSLRSRIDNVVSWTSRYRRWVPLVCITVERVKFDTQLLQQPEIAGVEYQRGELAGWEVRAYLLEQFGHTCAYCGRTDTPFELDHIQPCSRGGSDRVSNLALSCHTCNVAKGEQTAAEFGHPEVAALAKQPLRDAAAINALCVGQIAGARPGCLKTLAITATGRGRYSRTNVDKAGFPVGYLLRQKQVLLIKTGDRVQAVVTERVCGAVDACWAHRGASQPAVSHGQGAGDSRALLSSVPTGGWL